MKAIGKERYDLLYVKRSCAQNLAISAPKNKYNVVTTEIQRALDGKNPEPTAG